MVFFSCQKEATSQIKLLITYLKGRPGYPSHICHPSNSINLNYSKCQGDTFEFEIVPRALPLVTLDSSQKTFLLLNFKQVF